MNLHLHYLPLFKVYNISSVFAHKSMKLMLCIFNILTPLCFKNLSVCQIYTLQYTEVHCSSTSSSRLICYYLKAKQGYACLFHDHISRDTSFSEKSK